jgi:hypothetical protein
MCIVHKTPNFADVRLHDMLASAALPAALMKDGGCTPATLGWLLSEITIHDGVVLPAGVSASEPRSYVAALIARLLVLAAPG